MAKTVYQFRLRHGDSYLPPSEGEYATLDEAIEDAIAAAREILSEEVRNGKLDLGRCFEIVAGEGVVCAVVTFSEALGLADQNGGCS